MAPGTAQRTLDVAILTMSPHIHQREAGASCGGFDRHDVLIVLPACFEFDIGALTLIARQIIRGIPRPGRSDFYLAVEVELARAVALKNIAVFFQLIFVKG